MIMASQRAALGERPPKRPKVSIACDQCRAKKSKCDGIRPVCGPCARGKASTTQCAWDNGDSRNHQHARAEIDQLRKRVSELEAARYVPPEDIDSSATATTEPFAAPTADDIDEGGVQCRSTREPETMAVNPSHGHHSRQGHQRAHRASSLSQSSVSAGRGSTGQTYFPSSSGMIGSLPDDTVSHQYFGDSSAGSFVDQIRRVLRPKSGVDIAGHGTRSPAGIFGTSNLTASRSSYGSNYSLPLRSKADHLLQIYWDIIWPLYPYIDKYETMQKYDALWTGQMELEDDSIYICGLNVIFALSSQLNGAIEADQRKESARTFFERAKELLELWNIGSFESVQVLLLLGLYFQSTNDPHHCWTTVGIAIRTAQSLGLHLPETAPSISLRRRELQRKVWHACVLMDRVTSMTYGRPPMLTTKLATAVPRPLAVDEENLTASEDLITHLVDIPSVLDFFVQTLALYDVLYEVLVGFYATSTTEAMSTRDVLGDYLGRSEYGKRQSASILDIERRLVQWQLRLPKHLRIDPTHVNSEQSSTFHRQAIILQQRLLHIRLLSLRPVLSAYVTAETGQIDTSTALGGVLSQRVALACSVVCVNVALETIEIAYTCRSSDPSAVGPIAAWWYNVLFVYSAATVLIAAKLCPSIVVEIPEETIDRSWKRAIDILNHYRAFDSVIDQLVTVLRLLFNVLPEHYVQFKHAGEAAVRFPHVSSATTGTEQSVLPRNRIESSQISSSEAGIGGNIGPETNVGGFDYNAEFDFVFDNNDLSWLNTLPFDL